MTYMTREQARIAQEQAISEFLSRGGVVEVLKGRKNPKVVSARGKFNSGMKLRMDPTARFPRKIYV